jgi:hypothetical protein
MDRITNYAPVASGGDKDDDGGRKGGAVAVHRKGTWIWIAARSAPVAGGRDYRARLSATSWNRPPPLDHEEAAAQHEVFVAAIGRSRPCLCLCPPPCPAPPSPNAYASVAGFRLLESYCSGDWGVSFFSVPSGVVWARVAIDSSPPALRDCVTQPGAADAMSTTSGSSPFDGEMQYNARWTTWTQPFVVLGPAPRHATPRPLVVEARLVVDPVEV